MDWLFAGTYLILGFLTWEEKEWPNHIASTIAESGHRSGDTLLGEARHVGSDHGERDCDGNRISPED